MKLKQHWGRSPAEAVFITSFIQLVKIKGVWHGLNSRSCDPFLISSKAQRAMWAREIGIVPKDLENWMRREQRQRCSDHLKKELANAILVLERHGYEVDK